jgi:hypothetical protein
MECLGSKRGAEMNNSTRTIGILSTLLIAVSAPAQFICVLGKNCSCEDEKVAPNLTVAQSVRFEGTLFDSTGAPIAFKKTIVEVVSPNTDKVLAAASLNEEGRFDLGVIPAGKFRFIAVREQNGNAKRLPLFDQPSPVVCPSTGNCEVKIVLKVHGTDQPFEFCPPK